RNEARPEAHFRSVLSRPARSSRSNHVVRKESGGARQIARPDRAELLRRKRPQLSRRRDPETLRADEAAARRRAQGIGGRARRISRFGGADAPVRTRGAAAVIRMSKTFFIETWGCQMNDLDSQRLSGGLKLRGYRRSGVGCRDRSSDSPKIGRAHV